MALMNSPRLPTKNTFDRLGSKSKVVDRFKSYRFLSYDVVKLQ